MHFAAYKGDTAYIERLLEAHEDPDARDALGAAPLAYAARANKAPAVLALLAGGANINAEDREGISVVCEAATRRASARAAFDDAASEEAGEVEDEGVGAAAGEALLALLESGVDINAKLGPQRRVSPLMRAIASGCSANGEAAAEREGRDEGRCDGRRGAPP